MRLSQRPALGRAVLSASFALALFGGAARAQNSSQGENPPPSALTPPTTAIPHTLTLGDAISAAIARNYTIRTAANDARRNSIEVTRSEDALLPSASASASYGYEYSLTPLASRTLTIPADPATGSPQRQIITPAGSSSLRYDVSGSFNIFNGGADAARIRGSRANLTAAQSALTWTRQDIAFNVTSSFVNALRTQELVAAAEKTLSESRAELARVQGLYQAGTVPIGQVYQQQSVVGQNELGLIQARNNFENAKADVLFLMNVPPNEYATYTITAGGLDTNVSAAHRQLVDTAITTAAIDRVIDTRPDILSARAALEAQKANIDIARAALLPRLDVTAGIAGSGANSDVTKVHISNGLSAGLSLQVPIFDRNQNRLLIDEEEVDLETQRVRLEQDVQQIRSDVAKAANNLSSANQAIDAADRALVAAEESLRLATERLRVGAGTQVDVLIAEAQVETARTNQVNAKYNYVLAQRQVQYTLGQWNY